jgi:2-polyprenyl-3-methyl-5-hydroxy-6-metoxy-1,4-benzoquinol methylase
MMEKMEAIEREVATDAGTAASPKCPVCLHADRVSPLCVAAGHQVMTCGHCRADFVFPMPTVEELKAFYDREAWFESGEKGGYENYDAQTAPTLAGLEAIFDEFGTGEGRSVLDLGCGYGSHLQIAAGKGWQCFGVELSNHARGVAQERLGNRASIVESLDELIPHEFDLVLMLDVIEHLPDPYKMLYSLFSIGAITGKTRIVITTPNAQSREATKDPGAWIYRHPPSHLVYYAADTLKFLLERLHFKDIDVRGAHPLAGTDGEDLASCAGLIAQAFGSDFAKFMQERYVPGTWTKIAEYEHLPRYQFAGEFVAGRTVLDFGCGTGYGSATLASRASSVTGIDIDEPALAWARATHASSNLLFQQHADFCESLPPQSFDVITCFEMIEHVGLESQIRAVNSFARLLKEDGLLFISTPNPEVTALYGENPYHIREMSLEQFRELLGTRFSSVRIVEQYALASVLFANSDRTAVRECDVRDIREGDHGTVKSLAYVAICSNTRVPEGRDRIYLDGDRHMILEDLRHSSRLNQAKLRAYLAGQREENLQTQLKEAQDALDKAQKEIARVNLAYGELYRQVQDAQSQSEEAKRALDKAQQEIARVNLAYGELYRQVQDADATIETLLKSPNK